MDNSMLIALLVSFIWITFFALKLRPSFSKQGSTNGRLPPGPRPLPIIGNLHQLGERPHRSLAEFSKTYGPLICLKFGSIKTIVVSSSTVAKEMFQKHDLSLANRKVPAAVRANGHDLFSIAWLPICPKWRTLRKISAVHSLSNQRLDTSQSFRQAKVVELLDYVKGCSVVGEAVDLGKAAFTTSLNLLSNTFFSFDLASHRSSDSGEFKELVWKIMEEIGKPNLVDCFPLLRFVSSISVNCELMGYGNKLNEVFADIINQRLKDGVSDSVANDADVLDTLLRLMKEEDSELCLDDIKHLLMDFFTAGTDTTSSTLEWAMTELLHDPEKMIKAQAELEQALGKDNLLVQESDIPNLPYLQAIVKETLRMHPPTVFLLPRQADADVELYGYTVPKNSQILVNLWAISRDPNTWENPDVFTPERFLGRDIDMKGQDFGLIPFGAGRRICPGLTLAYRMLNLMLGTLIHAFNWKLANGLGPQDLDMMDKFGITIQKAQPLLAVPIAK